MTQRDEDDAGPWCTTRIECTVCNHAQVSTYPATAPRVECGQCGYMNATPPQSNDEDDTCVT